MTNGPACQPTSAVRLQPTLVLPGRHHADCWPLKPASHSSVTQLQPIGEQTPLSELLQPQSQPILHVFALLQPVLKELLAHGCLS